MRSAARVKRGKKLLKLKVALRVDGVTLERSLVMAGVVSLSKKTPGDCLLTIMRHQGTDNKIYFPLKIEEQKEPSDAASPSLGDCVTVLIICS